MVEQSKFCIFHIEGGLGKHVAATAVARVIKKNHPERELIVVCAYPEVFINLPFITRVFQHGHTPYFYQDYIKNKDFLIFKHEPYFTTEHIKKKTPLIENWCKLYNLEYHGELPEIIFNFRQQQFNSNLWKRSKPIFLIQTNGGPLEDQPYPYSWTRDIPPYIHDHIINYFRNTHHIIQICRNEHQSIKSPHVESITRPLSNMELFGLVQLSDKRLLIDSSLQHAAMALKKPSTVLWIGTSPVVFGYNFHRNITTNLNDDEFKLPGSYLFDYDFNGMIHECPIVDQSTMFDIQEIINSLKTEKLD